MQPLLCAAGVVEPVLDASAGLGRWVVRGAFFSFSIRFRFLSDKIAYCNCCYRYPLSSMCVQLSSKRKAFMYMLLLESRMP